MISDEERRYSDALFAEVRRIAAGLPSDPRNPELVEARRNWQLVKVADLEESINRRLSELERET